MVLRCLLVDDSAQFLAAARQFLERDGITIVGTASTSAEALERIGELRPDLALVDIDLGDEDGFEVARRIAEAPAHVPVVLISTHPEAELAELIETSPAVGFLSKADLSARAIGAVLRSGGCTHEALLYSTAEEFLATTVPFVRAGLEAEEPVLAATKQENLRILREALDADAGRVEFVDSAYWYRRPERTLEDYSRYVDARLAEGASRVRIIGEPVWPSNSPRAVAEWERYESAINVAWASTPVWVICPYDTGELPEEIAADAHKTHPTLRTEDRSRPSPLYMDPDVFVRELGLELSEILVARA